eukprot:TRINITY_DN333_c3_g1_i2.p1 TRINITY_DN333_c3_g1~~TRINITY_DN333_c3_g1_i2.p1  ORF type:complete len:818 (-),score=172.71 TRINITY_DN333_c3_g1_i2:49-2502(-)
MRTSLPFEKGTTVTLRVWQLILCSLSTWRGFPFFICVTPTVKCVDGKEEPMTTTGCTLQNFANLVADYAFKTNPYPLMLFCKIKCSPAQQVKVANIFKTTLKDLIPTPLTVMHTSQLPSPYALKRKVLLIGSVEPGVESELASLFFLHSYDVRHLPPERKPWHVLRISAQQIFPNLSSVVVEHSRSCLTIVHGTAERKKKVLMMMPTLPATCANGPGNNPCAAWQLGCQVVPLHPQNALLSAHLAAAGKFWTNGLCGYTRKPWFLAQDSLAFEDCTLTPEVLSTVTTLYTSLEIEVMSGSVLPKITCEKQTVDPFVELEMVGVPADCKTVRTKCIKNKRFKPKWFQKFSFPLTMSHHAILLFKVFDHSYSNEMPIAHAFVPVNCMRYGQRIIHLYDAEGNQPPMCTLFVRASLEENPLVVYPLCKHVQVVPELSLARSPHDQMCLNLMRGPRDEVGTVDVFADVACARSVNMYPTLPQTGTQLGTPICDQYTVVTFKDSTTLFALADGCSWGDRAKEAARKSVDCFCDYFGVNHWKAKSVPDLAKMLVGGLQKANRAISENKHEECEPAGTTTFLGGLLVRLLRDEDTANCDEPGVIHTAKKWACVFISVGDCKAFHWSSVTKEVQDITKDNRSGLDVTDPGGRLGPQKNGKADLRNLCIFVREVDPGDIIILTSDGVHDNFDAPSLGVTPERALELHSCGGAGGSASGGESPLRGQTWKQLEKSNSSFSTQLRQDFMCHTLGTFIKDHCFGPDSGGVLSVAELTNAVLDHCVEITQTSRVYMESNPKAKQPNDPVAFPGKLDHATCVSFRVGEIWV